MLISSGQLNITTAPTDGSANTNYLRGLIGQIIVKPYHENTQYNVVMINPIGAVIYERNGEVGTLSEMVSMPVHGIYTVEITGSSSAEPFIINLMIQE